ncbi:phenylcoumaran benzylic ether reductase POP1-like [Wolffia australiana]
MATTGKSRVLVIGGTGYIGKYIVQASAKAGNPTFILIRKSSVDSASPEKAALLQSFKDAGVTFLHGDLFDHESLVSAIRQADVVISAVGAAQLSEQSRIVAAIKEAGNVKRFLPSEFGNDVDRVHAEEPAKSVFEVKARFRRLVESEGIPHTFVASNFFAGYFLPSLSQPGSLSTPPRDKIVILGDGEAKGVYVIEEDIADYTIRSVDDPRALNKILYLRPPANILSFNELVKLWEEKIGKTLEKVYVPDEEVIKQIKESPFPESILLAIKHSALVRGDQTNFEIEPSFGVEGSQLYPDINYTTVSAYLDRFV